MAEQLAEQLVGQKKLGSNTFGEQSNDEGGDTSGGAAHLCHVDTELDKDRVAFFGKRNNTCLLS